MWLLRLKQLSWALKVTNSHAIHFNAYYRHSNLYCFYLGF
jgi:hypothetical protein